LNNKNEAGGRKGRAKRIAREETQRNIVRRNDCLRGSEERAKRPTRKGERGKRTFPGPPTDTNVGKEQSLTLGTRDPKKEKPKDGEKICVGLADRKNGKELQGCACRLENENPGSERWGKWGKAEGRATTWGLEKLREIVKKKKKKKEKGKRSQKKKSKEKKRRRRGEKWGSQGEVAIGKRDSGPKIRHVQGKGGECRKALGEEKMAFQKTGESGFYFAAEKGV